jgi:hypothetical protein
MHKNIITFIILLELSLLLFLPATPLAKEANISDVIVTNTEENLLAYFRVEDCFTEDMEEAILAGIPTTFTITMELFRNRNFWTDKRESLVELKHTIKYDAVKKIFFVVSSAANMKPEQFKSFEKAKIAMSDVNGVIVTPLTSLRKGKNYYLRIKAELDKVRLPLHLEYVFFFVSLWDFETDWSRQDFVY